MTRVMSATSAKEEEDYGEEEVHTSKWRLFMRLAQLSSPETGYNLLGLFASVVFGVGTPLFAILFGEAMDCFAIRDYDEALQKARYVVQQNSSLEMTSVSCKFFLYLDSNLELEPLFKLMLC